MSYGPLGIPYIILLLWNCYICVLCGVIFIIINKGYVKRESHQYLKW